MGEKDEERYWEIIGKLAGLRDVVARLLAYQASNTPDPDGTIRHFSEATAHHIYYSQKQIDGAGKVPSEGVLKLQDVIQSEVDAVVAHAQKIIADQRE